MPSGNMAYVNPYNFTQIPNYPYPIPPVVPYGPTNPQPTTQNSNLGDNPYTRYFFGTQLPSTSILPGNNPYNPINPTQLLNVNLTIPQIASVPPGAGTHPLTGANAAMLYSTNPMGMYAFQNPYIGLPPNPIYPGYGVGGLGNPGYGIQTPSSYLGRTVSPFVRWIEDYPLPKGMKIPNHLGYYEGKDDPDDYLYFFEGAVQMRKWAMPVACHAFSYVMKNDS